MKTPLLGIAILAVLTSCAAPSATATRANPLLGCWRCDETPTLFLRFEPEKAAVGRDGAYQAFRASYEPGRVVLNRWAKKVPWEITASADGQRLTATTNEVAGHYRRLESVPPEMNPTPLALGEATALPPERVKAIQEELVARREKDQAVRKDPALAKDAVAVDSENTARVKGLVREIGWIDADRFGAAPANSAFLIVQHSGDLALMMAALPHVESDMKRKLVSSQDYALLYDRVHVMLGEKQRFDSQVGHADGGYWVVMPLEDRSRVDEFRREIGLFTLGEYLDFMKANTPMKDVRFED
ncbi:MAG: hypothetical protein HYR85_09190 [Planctomycetes bacterium]|nr:hypothetical protein [Planctomycetota bacterium]